jgi:hypothetical protein
VRRIWDVVADWFDRNFTIKGLIGLLLWLIIQIPDWLSRHEFWKGKVNTLKAVYAFLLTPVGQIVAVFIGLIVIWLDHRSVLKKRVATGKPKNGIESMWVIHSALYGTGDATDVSITSRLNAANKDALAVPVNNNLISGDPDPAPNQPKTAEGDILLRF